MQNAGDSNTKVSDKQRNITRPVSLSVYIGINRKIKCMENVGILDIGKK